MSVEIGGRVHGALQIGDFLIGTFDHLPRQIQAKRLHVLADQGLEADEEHAGAHADVVDAQRFAAVLEQLLVVDLCGGPVESGTGDGLGIEVVIGGDDFVVLSLDGFGRFSGRHDCCSYRGRRRFGFCPGP